MSEKIPILLLAAGQASRMRGRDKLLEPVHGKPLLAHMAQGALGTGQPLTVALPPEPHRRYAALEGLHLSRLAVPDAHRGINATLRAGLIHLQDAPAVLILLADLPEITTAHLNTVLVARHTHPNVKVWRGATEDGAPGHPTLIDQSLFSDICALEGDQGAQSVLAKAPTALVPLPGSVARLDLDTPEEWDAWRANAKR